eukprot:COSAG01_NODE_23542_length_811_cov_1.286517_1_plen_132_part_00
MAGEIAKHGQALSAFLGSQSTAHPGDQCIAGSGRKRFDWGSSYGARSDVGEWRGKKMNSVNGRSVYAQERYSYPRKKMYEEAPRGSRKGPAAHLVMLANGGEVTTCVSLVLPRGGVPRVWIRGGGGTTCFY